jgi:hypothetical protein
LDILQLINTGLELVLYIAPTAFDVLELMLQFINVGVPPKLTIPPPNSTA